MSNPLDGILVPAGHVVLCSGEGDNARVQFIPQNEVVAPDGYEASYSGWGNQARVKFVLKTDVERGYAEQRAKFNELVAHQEREAEQINERSRLALESQEAERRVKFAQAAQTGKKVLLYAYDTDCTANRRDCDCDTVRVYAMPDGSTQKSISHSY